MNRQGRVAALASAALVVCLGAAACQDKDLPIAASGGSGIEAEALNELVMQYLTDKEAAGATVAVTRAGRLVWSTGYGWADENAQTPMKPWHRGRIGSTSKMLTTIGLLQLLESAAGEGDLTSLAIGGSLQTLLSTKLYGDPGHHWNNPGGTVLVNPGQGGHSWPNVTGKTALANPELYWEALRESVDNYTPGQDDIDMDELIEWASSIDIRHLLTHTSGHLRGGDRNAAAAYFNIPNGMYPTYSQVHQYMLMGLTSADENSDDVQCFLDGELHVDKEDEDYTGQDYPMPPLRYEPGTKRCYSNHGFGVVGMIIDEIAGPGEENTYRRVIQRNILEPLGLFDVVPRDWVNGDSDLDAFPHGSQYGVADPGELGLATGGWTASAQDLARIMCGIDRNSNNLRLLDPATVSVMETVAFPDVDADQPLGWDSRDGLRLTKNGVIGGGASRVAKYLPGMFAGTTEDEINVAVVVNDSVSAPGTDLLDDIAALVAAADIPHNFDLFDPDYRCFVPEQESQEPGLVAPGATITEPPAPPPLVNPTPTTDPPSAPPTPSAGSSGPLTTNPPETRTPRIPPTVTIHLPYNGWQPAPRGVAQISFHGTAVDSTGTPVSGTRLRWTAIEGGKSTVLCVGSAFGPAPSTIGGFVNPADCTSFTRQFTNSANGSGPNITIRLEARDQAGLIGTAEVIIALYTPPVR